MPRFYTGPLSVSQITSPTTQPYVGPGDIFSGAIGWWGLRGYSAAYSTGLNPAIRVVDSGGANAQDILVLSNGALDVATLTSWIGTHGTASVTTIYDQTATGRNLTQATVANMPTIGMTSGPASLPAFVYNGSAWIRHLGGLTQAQPFVYAGIVNNTNSPANQKFVCDDNINISWGVDSITGGLWNVFAGSTGTFSASAATWHSGIIVYDDAGSGSTSKVDTAAPASNTFGTNNFGASDTYLGSFDNTSNFLVGFIYEMGIWPGHPSTGTQANLASNMHGIGGGW